MANANDDHKDDDDDKGSDRDKLINLVIGTTKGNLTAKFKPSATVVEVIAYTIEKMELGGSADVFEMYLREGQKKTLLEPITNTLASFGIKSGAKLILAATGSGV